MGGQISDGLNEQPHDVLMPPEPGVEYRPPTVLIIGVNGIGILGDQCTYRLDVSAAARFVDRGFGHTA